jgi:putative ABC transport system permease protein
MVVRLGRPKNRKHFVGFTAFLLKNLLRRKVRSLLTILAIALAVGTQVTLLGISDGFENSFRNIFAKRGIDLVVLSRFAPLQLLSDLDEKVGDDILKMPGVKAVDCGLTGQIAMHRGDPEPGGEDIPVLVQGYLSESLMFEQFVFTSGRKYEPGETGVALLGSRQAAILNKDVGDYLKVENETLKVIGIYEAPSVFENGFVMVPLRELQRMLLRKGRVTGFSIILEHGETDYTNSVREAVEALKDQKGKSQRLSAEPLSKYVSGSMHIQLAHAMAWMTSVIAVVMGAVGMLNTMLMAVFERIKEIGILRAIGWRRSRVIKMVLGESLLLSLIGAFVGTVGGILLTRWLTTFPQVAGYIEGDIPFWVLVEGTLMAVGVGLIGGIYPALRAANLKPTEALRHE